MPLKASVMSAVNPAGPVTNGVTPSGSPSAKSSRSSETTSAISPSESTPANTWAALPSSDGMSGETSSIPSTSARAAVRSPSSVRISGVRASSEVNRTMAGMVDVSTKSR